MGILLLFGTRTASQRTEAHCRRSGLASSDLRHKHLYPEAESFMEVMFKTHKDTQKKKREGYPVSSDILSVGCSCCQRQRVVQSRGRDVSAQHNDFERAGKRGLGNSGRTLHRHVAKVGAGGRGPKEEITGQIADSVHETTDAVSIESGVVLERVGKNVVVDVGSIDLLVTNSLKALRVRVVESLGSSKLILQCKQMDLLDGLRRGPVDCVMTKRALENVRELNVKVRCRKSSAEEESFSNNVHIGLARTVATIQTGGVAHSVAALRVFSAGNAGAAGRIGQATTA